jgi:hypothetical protein
MKTIKGIIRFTEEVLGTACSDPDVHSEFIASNAPDAPSREEEIAALGADAVERKEMTIFPRDEDGDPMFWDYQIKGFFKDACGCLRKITGSKCSKVKAYKKEIDGLIFVNPRKIKIHLPEGGECGNCQRPLRASTAQGERIALANSETVPAGSWCEMEITMLKDDLEGMVEECLDYGKLKGIGQWRNSSKGRFVFEKDGDTVKEKFAL